MTDFLERDRELFDIQIKEMTTKIKLAEDDIKEAKKQVGSMLERLNDIDTAIAAVSVVYNRQIPALVDAQSV